jgi:nicotinamidase-related amidase
MKPVFIVVDMCFDFFLEGRLRDLRPSLSRAINELATSFRASGSPIIWVRQEFEPDLSDAFLIQRKNGISKTIKGTPGAQFLPELEIRDDELEIIKKRYSAFFGTNLDSVLKDLKPTHLVLAGVNTHACIRTAAVDAYQRDYEVILADEGINSYDLGFHEDSKRYLEGRVGKFMSNAEIIKKFRI